MAIAAPAPQRVKQAALLATGSRVDQYEIIRPIGAGGMGQVFLARDVKLGRLVALKVLFPTSSEIASRMLVEARATAKCKHENIVVIYDMNEYQGMPYLVLEYLEGSSLRKLDTDSKLSLVRAIEVMVAVTRALEHAHAAGIIHRDLKPDNIFVTKAGATKVLDFGIAKLHGTPNVDAQLYARTGAMPAVNAEETYVTISGQGPVGTRSYMSPEQWSGIDVDGKTDVWAVGVILFRLVAGVHPVERANEAALMYAVMSPNEPIRSVASVVPDIHPGLAEVIDRCLRKPRAERYDAHGLRVALEALLPERTSRRHQVDERCPFPGLEAFQEADAERFYGREDQVNRVKQRLETQPLLAIVGPSGVGKSSFVRAGVVPALKQDAAWDAFVMRPGRAPLVALAACLGTPREMQGQIAQQLFNEPGYLGQVLRGHAQQTGRRVMLYVDQLEELYTLVPDPRMRAAFATCLRAAADDPSSPVRVIVSLRSDFLDRAAEDRAFMAAITEGLHYLMPLGYDGLWTALVKPVEQAGHGFESQELVQTMLDEMAQSASALPLLQFAAAKMWDARDRARRMLTAASYHGMGGIAGALAVHADAVLNEMPYDRKRLAQRVFQRLVTADHTRAIVDLAELATLSPGTTEIQVLVDRLVGARLLVSKDDGEGQGATVEIVHESLITAWPQLRQWADAGRDEATFLVSLRQAAQQWEQRGTPSGLLWRGDAADEARRFEARLGNTLGPRERRYLDAVLALATRSVRIRRVAVIATMIVLAAMAMIALLVVVKVRSAEHEALRQADEAKSARAEVDKQLVLVQAKETARAAAEAEAAEAAKHAAAATEDSQLSRAELEKANASLTSAVAAARNASEHERDLRLKVEALLAAEKQRADALAKQRSKIATGPPLKGTVST